MGRSKRKATRNSLKLENKIDDALSRGFSSLAIIILVISLITILSAATSYYFIASDASMPVTEALWYGFKNVVSPDAPSYAEMPSGSFAIITLLALIVGLLLTSALIGVITTSLTNYYDGIKRGFSPVLEDGHIAVLGFRENVETLIREFVEAHDNGTGCCLVFIDAEKSRVEMERAIALAFGINAGQVRKIGNCKIICRSGNTKDVDDLRRCAVQQARSIIINEYRDDEMLKTLLAVSSLLRQELQTSTGKKAPAIVCTFRDNHFARAAAHIGHEKELRVLSVADTLSNLLAKTCYQPGLSKILNEVFSYFGSEFYTQDASSLIGERFDDVLCSFNEAIPIGIIRKDESKICGIETIICSPQTETRSIYDEVMTFREGDEVILLAENEKSAAFKPLPSKTHELAKAASEMMLINPQDAAVEGQCSQRTAHSILVLGYDETFDKTIMNLAKYYSVGKGDNVNCEIKLLYRIKRESRVLDARKRFLSTYCESGMSVYEAKESHGISSANAPIKDIIINSTQISFQCVGSNSIDLPILEEAFLSGKSFNHVIVLSDLQQDREEADTETLLTLLYLKAIADNAKYGRYGNEALTPFEITSEIQNISNLDLAYNEYVSDYIISWNLIACFQVQIAENISRYKIIRDFLRPGGPEIQMEPARRFLPNEVLDGETPIDFDYLSIKLRSLEDSSGCKRILIGYFDEQNGKHTLCPKRDANGNRLIYLNNDDMIVVVKTDK